jgi:hypothetical protein
VSEIAMKSGILFGALILLLLSGPTEPASAQHVIPNPGRCAQHFPNANCQNYGYGNPYTSYGWRRPGHRHYYSGHRYHRRHWR